MALVNSLQDSILKTLAYADIFDYPLTVEEIWRYLITPEKIKKSDFLAEFKKNKPFSGKSGLFCLKGREIIIDLRKQKERWSLKKWQIAQGVGVRLKWIPWIEMVGVSGSLAMNNCQEQDDIDLVIIASENRLWLTRFLTVLTTELLGVRRQPKSKIIANTVCLNLFLDKKNLTVPLEKRNLYSAHEVSQLKVLWQKGEVYLHFLQENRWIETYLPNVLKKGLSFQKFGGRIEPIFIGDLVENFAKKCQLWYMSKGRTIERISDNQAFFHPNDCSRWVLERYERKINELTD